MNTGKRGHKKKKMQETGEGKDMEEDDKSRDMEEEKRKEGGGQGQG